MVAFNRMPTAIRVPFAYFETNSGVSYFAGNSKHLVIGQMLAGATAVLNKPQLIQVNNISTLFGAGSMLVSQIRTAKSNNSLGEIWALPLADPAGSVAIGKFVIDPDGTPVPGVLVVYVQGKRIAISVTASDTAETLAEELVAAINAGWTDLNGQGNLFAVTAAVGDGTDDAVSDVVMTARHAGLLGNYIDLASVIVGDEGPNAGLITIVPMGGVAATGTISLPTNPTANQTLTLGGTVWTFVASGATGNQVNIATGSASGTVAALLAKLQSSTDTNTKKAVYTGGGNATTIAVTYGVAGTAGNSFAMSSTVTGATVSASLAGGAGQAGAGIPDFTAGLAACGDTEFDMISMPYADITSLQTMGAFLADSGGRWDPLKDLYGHCFTVNFGNLSAQATLGSQRNDPHVSIMGVQQSPSAPWDWAAAIGAQAQLHKNLGADLSEAIEISRPMQTLVLNGIMGPTSIADRWAQDERNTLYYDGIAAFTVNRDGSVAIDRLVTTYQTNLWGDLDTTWLDIDTLYQTMYANRYYKQYMTQKHPRDAFANDNPAGIQGLTTPSDLRADLIHCYSNLVNAGVMKNLALFSQNVSTEQAADPDRANAYLPDDVVNQLRIFAANSTTFLNAAAA